MPNHCKNCGAPLTPGKRFCGDCGAPVPQTAGQDTAQNNGADFSGTAAAQSKTRRFPLWSLIPLACCAAALILLAAVFPPRGAADADASEAQAEAAPAPTAAGAPEDTAQQDAAVAWTSPVLEQLARDYLGKPEGEILASELSGIHSIFIKNATTAVNGVSANGTELSWEEWNAGNHAVRAESDTIDLADLRNFTELQDLAVLGYQSVLHTDALKDLPNLRSLALSGYAVLAGDGVLGCSALESLELISSGIADASVFEDMPALVSLDLSVSSADWGDGITSVLDPATLAGLTRLRSLRLSYCGLSDADVAGLSNLSGLETLDVTGNNLGSLNAAAVFPALKTLRYSPAEYWHTTDLSAVSGMTGLKELELTACGIQDAAFLSGLTNLERLDLTGNLLSSVEPLNALTELTWLDIGGNQILDITPLAPLVKLTYLDISLNYVVDSDYNTTFLYDVSPLAGMTRLRELNYFGNGFFPDCTPLSGLSDLKIVEFGGISRFDNIATITSLSSVRELSFRSLCTSISRLADEDLEYIVQLPALEKLNLYQCFQITDISQLSGAVTLKELNLTGTCIADIAPLANLTNLTVLKLRNTSIYKPFAEIPYSVDISPLAALTKLRVLDLSKTSGIPPFIVLGFEAVKSMPDLAALYLINTKIDDITPLTGLKKLRYLDLEGAEYEPSDALEVLSGYGCAIVTE